MPKITHEPRKPRELTYNETHHTVMANDVVKGKQEMTLQEARLLRLLITQVAKEDKDLMTYTTKISELAKFLSIPKNNLYRDVKNICDSLMRRVVRIGTGNPRQPWKIFQWIQLASYDGKGNLTLMLSEQIEPFVIGLNEYFTQYQLANILAMNSVYAIRLYEILKSDEYRRSNEYPTYTVKELREAFECEKKHTQFGHFKTRVIDVAVREINAKTDIHIRDVEYIKDSRAVVGLRFIFGYLKPTPELPGQLTLDGNEADS